MEHKISKPQFSLVIFCAFMLASGSVAAQKVYRWVDENGEVHYSQSLPPDFEDKKHDVLDERGIVREADKSLVPPPPPPPEPKKDDDLMELPRDSSGMERPKALYSEQEMKRRMDRFLMLRYDSEQEILDAMNVEINQLEYDRRLLQKSRDSMYEAYRGQIKQAANHQRSGSEADSEAIASIMGLQSRLESNEASLNSLTAREEEIKESFNAELERYRHLVETWSEDA
jgi:hypothetical protein